MEPTPTQTEQYSRLQLEKEYGIPAWAIAEITKKFGIQPQYARLSRPGKREALHALYTPLQVMRIRTEYDRIKKEAKLRKERIAKERFSSDKQKAGNRSLRATMVAMMERIEARQVRLEQRLNMTPTFTTTPLQEDETLEYVPTVTNGGAARGVDQ